MSRVTEVYLQLEFGLEGGRSALRELLADRLAFESGELLVWDRGEVVFRCPTGSVLSIVFAPAMTAYTASARRSRGRASTRWTPQDEIRLVQLDEAGETVETIARTLERNEGAIRARLMRLRNTPSRPDPSAENTENTDSVEP